jgi:hypothetical protein
MARNVQTTLEEEEYRVFKELMESKNLSLREGLRMAVARLLEEQVKVDPKDPFLTRKPTGKSGVDNLSTKHDRYLYGAKRRRGSS